MSQFRSTGGLDDSIASDGDRGFYAVNQRLQLNQLDAGEVRESLNGRMDGFWRPRKNVVSVSPALTTGGNPLALPFHILPSPYYLAISNVSYADPVVTITTSTNHGLVVGVPGNIDVSGLTYTGNNPNGIRAVTATTANQLTFSVAGSGTVNLGSTPRITQISVNDAAASEVLASCVFSDPNDSNKEYIIVALETLAKKIDISVTPMTATTLPYPVGATVGQNCDMVQCFDKVMLFRDGQQALEWHPHGRPVVSASQAGTTTVTMNVRDHGLTAGTSVVIAGLTGGTPPNGTFTVASVINKDSFTYVGPTAQTVTFGITSATMSDGFTLSPGGPYTQPQVFNIQAKDVDVVSGLVSAAVVGNTTIFAGDTITIYSTATTDFQAMLGQSYQVVNATSTLIQWYAPIGDYNTSASDVFEFGGRFSVGGGFMHQPGAPWGTYFQRRIWVPYYYEPGGTFGSYTYTSRKITDEIVASDILDTTTFDQIANQFRVSGGTADYVVAMHGFYDDALVVLNRNSLHIVANTQGSLSDSIVKEMTSEVGCLARKTVVMQANNMLFLSDNGIYGLTFLNDYNLRGIEEPLSKNIQPYIDRINKNLADKSVAILYDNRYYIAVPLDSVAGANDARGNNSVLVYNFLNKGWESLDTYGDSRFLIKNFIKASSGVRNELYAISANGGLHQVDATDSSVDRLSITNGGDVIETPTIDSYVVSRGYDFKTLERKRFTDAQIQMQNLPDGKGEYDIAFGTEDPDSSESIGTTTDFLGGVVLDASTPNEAETASIRCRLGGLRGYTGTITLTRTIGSPKIHSIQVSGSVTNRQILSQK